MSEIDKRTIEEALGEELGFLLVDDNQRQCASYWGVLSGHDDERLDKPVRDGEWPQESQLVIQRLWHKCVKLAEECAKRKSSYRKLNVVLAISVFSFLLLYGLLHNNDQFDRAWHYCGYLVAALVGAMLANWFSFGAQGD